MKVERFRNINIIGKFVEGQYLSQSSKKQRGSRKAKIKDNKNTRVVPPPSGEPGSTAPLGEAGTERGTQGTLNEKQKTYKNQNNRRSEEKGKARSEIMKEKRIDNSRKHKDKKKIKEMLPNGSQLDGWGCPPTIQKNSGTGSVQHTWKQEC